MMRKAVWLSLLLSLLTAGRSAFAQTTPCVTSSQVTLAGNLRSANGLPSSNYTLSLKPSAQGYIAGCGVNTSQVVSCATSTDGSVVGLPNPTTASNVTTAGGGALAPGIYYSMYAWYDASGNVTLPSPESRTSLSTQGSIVINPPAAGVPAGAVGMYVYIATTPGGETQQGQTSTPGGSYVQSTALVSGASPSASNSTQCAVTANDAIWPSNTGYIASLNDSNGNAVPGYPMQWQLLGAGTTINLSNGLPYYHGVVTYPIPVLTSPTNHGQQSISGPLNMSGYPITNLSGLGVQGSPVGSCLLSSGTLYQPGWCLSVFDIRQFGAQTGIDNTTAIQAAVNAAAAVGGIVYVPEGVWPVNGPVQSSCDGIICIPVISNTSSAEQFKIIGTTRNRQDAAGPNNVTGSVITTTSTGINASSSIFAVAQNSIPFGSNMDVYFRDLTIRTYPNPAIGCINTFWTAGADIDGVRCEVGENYEQTNHTQPTNVSTGITLPQTGNDTLSFLTRSEITGYYQGVNMSEHTYLNDVWVAFGIQGYFIDGGYNPITGHFGCEEVGTCIETLNGVQMDVSIAIELDPLNVFGCASWCYSTTDISDTHNHLNGSIRYYLSEAQVGNVTFPIRVNSGGYPLDTLPATYYNLTTSQFNKLLTPIITSVGTLPTCVGGTGITCTIAAGSTEARGTLTLALSGVTIESPLATVTFGSPLAGNPFCQAWQAGGSSWYGIYVNGGASNLAFSLSNINSLAGQTSLIVGYSCQE